MKKLNFLLGVTLLLTLSLRAQESTNNFSLENNKVIWQRVFETDMEFGTLVERIRESGVLLNFTIGDNKVMGDFKPIEADYVGAGYSEMTTPMYIARSFFKGYAVIEFKDEKYRVTLKNIMLAQKYDDGISDEGEKSTLESWAVKRRKSEFKRAFSKSPSKILNYTFTETYTFIPSTNNDSW